jgi:HPt (histidine-containing phosphotransfer) domain-containing protein
VAPIAPTETPQHWSRTEGFGFDDDTVGWLENKGFENPQAAITSQRELEKKMGGPPEMLQKWPESDDKDGFDAIYHRLGTPKDVEGYKFEFEEGAAVDPDTLTWFKKTALGRRMPNDMAQGVILDWNTEVARLQGEQQQSMEVQDQIEETELRNTWGTKYDERIDYGRRALVALGLEEEKIDSLQSALGPKVLAQMAAKIADAMGEDTIANETDTPAFGTSKEQVEASIKELADELGADKKRFDRFRADHSAPKELTDKDFRKMEQLKAQLRGLVKAGG